MNLIMIGGNEVIYLHYQINLGEFNIVRASLYKVHNIKVKGASYYYQIVRYFKLYI